MLTLDRVDIEHIPMTNLRALVKYVEHPGWPDLGRLPTSSPKKRNPVKARGDPNNDNALRRQMIQDGSLAPPDQIEEDEDAAVPALVRLTEWANAVIQYVLVHVVVHVVLCMLVHVGTCCTRCTCCTRWCHFPILWTGGVESLPLTLFSSC